MDRLKDIPSPKEIKDALERAPDSDLLNEVLRRGLIVNARQWPAPGPLDETMGDETMTDGTTKYWETLRERGTAEEDSEGRQARVMRVAIKILTSSNDDCPILELAWMTHLPPYRGDKLSRLAPSSELIEWRPPCRIRSLAAGERMAPILPC
jgi:hypothetical protein